MHPISHELPLQWFQMRDVGISCSLSSVILRYPPYISVQNFAPLPVRSLADGRRPASPNRPFCSKYMQLILSILYAAITAVS